MFDFAATELDLVRAFGQDELPPIAPSAHIHEQRVPSPKHRIPSPTQKVPPEMDILAPSAHTVPPSMVPHPKDYSSPSYATRGPQDDLHAEMPVWAHQMFDQLSYQM